MDTPKEKWLDASYKSDPEHLPTPPAESGSRLRRPPAKLPPLNLFRAFDAAARHRSFRLAADELCLTSSAISQQIRQLEDFLGTRLFRRLPRQVELTREGTALANIVQEALALLGRGCSRLVDPATPTVLCVSVSPSLASCWLVGHLKDFMEEFPQIKITLLASNDPVDFRHQDIDVAIRWGSGDWRSDVFAEPLTSDYVLPVCSPEYLKEHDLCTPEGLARATTLLEVPGNPWTSWMEAADCSISQSNDDVLYFGNTALMLEAAVAGQGVSLASCLLAAKELSADRLVAPFDTLLDLDDEGYYILSSVDFAEKPAIKAFRDWLRYQAKKTVDSQIGGKCRATLPAPDMQPELLDHL